MALSILKETIELTSLETDADGNAYATKRINLQKGKVHSLLQVDMFRDRLMVFPKFVKKDGTWKKDGFKRCVKAAHAAARRKK